MCVTDTEDGHVVINGPPDNGYELLEDGINFTYCGKGHKIDHPGLAARLGLCRLDRVISLNGTSVRDLDANGVQDMVRKAGRPLQIVLARESPERDTVPAVQKKSYARITGTFENSVSTPSCAP